jgi:hypothetical protein
VYLATVPVAALTILFALRLPEHPLREHAGSGGDAGADGEPVR